MNANHGAADQGYRSVRANQPCQDPEQGSERALLALQLVKAEHATLQAMARREMRRLRPSRDIHIMLLGNGYDRPPEGGHAPPRQVATG